LAATDAAAGDGTAKIALSPIDGAGLAVPAPSGEYGKAIHLRLPLVCSAAELRNIKINPVMSTDVESFPFKIETVDNTKEVAMDDHKMVKGDIEEIAYDFTVSSRATKGVKKVDFLVTYECDVASTDDEGDPTVTTVTETAIVSLFVNITKGVSTGGGTSVPSFKSQPKVIVASYNAGADKTYAGETFTLTMEIRNTSPEEAVKNIQISMADSTGNILPANNGSNTMYIKRIEKDASETISLELQSVPDAEAKAYMLELSFSYDGVSSKQAYTAAQSIAIPISQQIRIKCDDPAVYDEAWVNQSAAMYCSLYNLGKSAIYNCIVDVEGDGLAMEETYFGGNIAAGSSMRADFNIIPSIAGQIEAAVVISYEDVYGQKYEERLPFSLFVNEDMGGAVDGGPIEGIPGKDMDVITRDTMGEAVHSPLLSVGGWVLGLLIVAGGAVAVIIVLKKRRAKSSEEI